MSHGLTRHDCCSRLHRFDAVLFTDTDVDMLPLRTYRDAAALSALQREWARVLPRLIDERTPSPHTLHHLSSRFPFDHARAHAWRAALATLHALLLTVAYAYGACGM